MAQAKTATMTESFVDNAKRMSEDLLDTGKNVFFAGLGIMATTEERAREVFDQMVDRGQTYEKDDSTLLSRATHEAKEFGGRLEQRAQNILAATLNRANVPSRDEIRHLTERVETLTRKVDALASK